MNAVITSAYVGYGGPEDNFLGLYVMVKTEEGGCFMAEGRFTLYVGESSRHHNKRSLLGHVIAKWLEATGCKDVAEMEGRPVRIEYELDRWSCVIVTRVGHFIDDDKWFSTQDICEVARREASND